MLKMTASEAKRILRKRRAGAVCCVADKALLSPRIISGKSRGRNVHCGARVETLPG